MKIIISSDEPWGEMLHTQLRYALELSARYEVYYMNPPESWNIFSVFKTQRMKSVSQSLFLLPYYNPLPVIRRLPLTVRINDWFNFKRIKKIIGSRSDETILWRFDSMRMVYSGQLKNIPSIYHVVDDYRWKKENKILGATSDIIVVTSPRNIEHFKMYNPHVICVPQALSDEDFRYNTEESERIRKKFGNFILFIGSVSDANDYRLLNELAGKFIQNNLLLIGPVLVKQNENKQLLHALCSRSNVHWLGKMDGRVLKNYIRASSSCIIPYTFDHHQKNSIRSPLKALHYLAQSRPVISSVDCEIPALENKAIYRANDPEHFLNLVEQSLQNKLEFNQEEVNRYLSELRYPLVIDSILAYLEKVRLKKNN